MNPTPKTQTPEPQTSEAPTPEAAEAGAIEDRTTDSAAVASDGPVGPEAEAAGENAAVTDTTEDEDLEVLGDEDDDEPVARASSGLAAASTAIVALCLGIIALTGSWTGTIGAARETVVGQLNMPQTADVSRQVSEGFGDGWHVTAVINGSIALLALIVAVVALLLPQRQSWVRPFAVAAVVLGALGVIVSLGMYFDLFASMPTAPKTPPAAPVAPPAG